MAPFWSHGLIGQRRSHPAACPGPPRPPVRCFPTPSIRRLQPGKLLPSLLSRQNFPRCLVFLHGLTHGPAPCCSLHLGNCEGKKHAGRTMPADRTRERSADGGTEDRKSG